MLGMETSKELVKVLLVLLHGTLFPELPPEYFIRAQCDQNFQLGQDSPRISQHPADTLLLFSPASHGGNRIFHCKPCLGMYPFAAW